MKKIKDYSRSKLYFAIPAMDEAVFLPSTLDCFRKTEDQNFEVFICVNQPEHYHSDRQKQEIVANNQETLRYLQNTGDLPLFIIDRSSPGKGWPGKKCGVGHARKVVMDAVAGVANENDLIVSLDADTLFEKDYPGAIRNSFCTFPETVCLSVPYNHQLCGNEAIDRCMLRYELYMRNYFINLSRINSPYAFTAVGSAMVIPVWVYKSLRGITPKTAGEDFYFLQKLRKFGNVLNFCDSMVYPSSRPSSRVDFGTGPAIIKGLQGDWESYPIYHPFEFDEIKRAYDLLPGVFRSPANSLFFDFINQQTGEEDFFIPLRENFIETGKFIRACHDKMDALRILQFLKLRNKARGTSDEENLLRSIEANQIIVHLPLEMLSAINFETSPVEVLEQLRNDFFEHEMNIRKTNPVLSH